METDFAAERRHFNREVFLFAAETEYVRKTVITSFWNFAYKTRNE